MSSLDEERESDQDDTGPPSEEPRSSNAAEIQVEMRSLGSTSSLSPGLVPGDNNRGVLGLVEHGLSSISELVDEGLTSADPKP